MYIPYGTQSIDESDIQAVVDVLRSDYLTTGPAIAEFEEKTAEAVGAKYAVAIANGTAALHASCFAAGIGKGDEVITTPITFAASANCALYCGAVPVFADIKADTYNIDPAEIEKKITSRTKAIIAVDFTGQPCEMEQIYEIAEKHNLTVIEDAAHALGADYFGKRVGSLSDMTTFSFHPVKHITTGEGGMIVTDQKELYERLKLFRTHGITREEQWMDHSEGAWYYQQIALGYNYRITDIQCALGVSQLKKLDGFVSRRRELAKRYDEAFAPEGRITVPQQQEGCRNSYHLYVIQVPERRRVFDQLRAAGIGVNVHYIPVYKHPYYQKNGYESVCCPNAEAYYAHCISLPLYPALTQKQQDYVIEQVKAAVAASEKKLDNNM
ncbi:MAG: UDP-4-amino-4,6-dideoxy-N-acetyl-beta-L-altrosamine transaminase [Clostridiaceae bacterium]|nr:UDP-4-amino-4,6-dideoxy-N-acetyl-beta-L-altrosamine transaminase [Clostridiaceae bacterium]